ncbi:MAG: hypothetical protein Q9167_002011 [Letrouitia subvulpina]
MRPEALQYQIRFNGKNNSLGNTMNVAQKGPVALRQPTNPDEARVWLGGASASPAGVFSLLDSYSVPQLPRPAGLGNFSHPFTHTVTIMAPLTVSLASRHPLRAIYILYVILAVAPRVPFWLIYYLPRSLRQHPQWSYKQAILIQLFKTAFPYAINLRLAPPMSLDPLAEKTQWVTVKPSPTTTYMDILQDPDIKPETIGGTWYPDAPQQVSNQPVILHLHGGAFVIGDGRKENMAFGANVLLKHVRSPFRIFAPQYRVSSHPNCRFPAALQDAVTAYEYLRHELGVPAEHIVLSGDSAGGNLAIALLRYILSTSDVPPKPRAVLLWSPWVDPAACAFDANVASKNRNGSTDFLVDEFVNWGIETYQSPHVDWTNAYISPLRHPFDTQGVPLWVQLGEVEILADDIIRFVEAMRGVKGNEVDVHSDGYAPHDTFIAGKLLGFEREAEVAAKAAGEWLREKVALGASKT